MSRIFALLLGIAGLLIGTFLPDVVPPHQTLAASAFEPPLASSSNVESSVEAALLSGAVSAGESASANRTEALSINIVDLPASAADRVAYVEGDVGVALRGTDVSAHVDGRPTSNVRRIGNGLQIYNRSVLVAEVALRPGPDGLAVDWVWAPQSYYGVTFPSLGVRVTGERSDPGEASMDALRVTHVDPGSPAEAAGLTAGSRIDAVQPRPSHGHDRECDAAATPLALRQGLAQTHRGTSALRLRIQPPEARDDSGAVRLVTIAPASAPIQ